MALSVFTFLCNHYHHQSPDLLSSPQTETNQTVTAQSFIPSAPGSQHSNLHQYKFDYSWYLIKVE